MCSIMAMMCSVIVMMCSVIVVEGDQVFYFPSGLVSLLSGV